MGANRARAQQRLSRVDELTVPELYRRSAIRVRQGLEWVDTDAERLLCVGIVEKHNGRYVAPKTHLLKAGPPLFTNVAMGACCTVLTIRWGKLSTLRFFQLLMLVLPGYRALAFICWRM